MEYLLQAYIAVAPAMFAVGVAWAPFAVVIGLVVTRERRRTRLPDKPTTGRFVYVTALHSAMMVFPWIYLFAYWIGKPMPLRLAQFGYAAMCLRWFFSPAWVGLYVGARALLDMSAGWGWGLEVGFIVSMVILLGLNWWALFRLIRGMLRRKSVFHTKQGLLIPSNDLYYLKPIFLWLIMDIGTIFVGFYIFIFFWNLAYSVS